MNVDAILKAKGREVTTARSTDTLETVARQLAAGRIGAVVVVNERGGIEGIISERDIIRTIGTRGVASLQEPASKSMTAKVKFCEADDTLDELMATMTAGRFRHLPVVESGRLAGIVSIGDVVKHHIAAVEMEASVLRDYIAAG